MPRILSLSLAAVWLMLALPAAAQDTTITYQGQLQQNGQPFTGTANLQFQLFDQLIDGNQVGGTVVETDWPVEDGLFQVELDFGIAAFDGSARFLEVWVNGAPLSPRQAVRPAPVSIHALNVSSGGEGSTPFSVNPNTGAIEYLFAGSVIRFEPGTTSAPRIVFGHADNAATATGAVVSGGGSSSSPNTANAQYSTVGGGFGNNANDTWTTIGGGARNFTNSQSSTVGGGSNNTASESRSTIAGGSDNTASGFSSTVGGGLENIASGSSSNVAGGRENAAISLGATIGGGQRNEASGSVSTVSGGDNNTASGSDATVGGGGRNTASGPSSTVSGGRSNTASGSLSAVGAGFNNCAGGRISWAGGLRAKVRPGFDSGQPGSGCNNISLSGDSDGDEGTFVWADSQNEDFISAGPDQFLIRAAGGVGINTNSPATNLHLGGLNTSSGSPDGIRFENIQGRRWDIHTSGTSLLFNYDSGNDSTSVVAYVRNDGTWFQLSDRRLKNDIKPIETVLGRVAALEVVDYRFNHDAPDAKRQIGLIAQDVAEQFPELASREGEDGYLGVNYAGFSVVALKAIQEQQAVIEVQQTRIDELASQVSTLKTQTEHMVTLSGRNEELEARLAALEALLIGNSAQSLDTHF